jgi:hypothetical protein
MTDEGDHVIARGELALVGHLDDTAQRLVPKDETILPFGRFAIRALDDLLVGAVDPDRDRLDEHRAFGRIGLGDVG